MLCRFQQRSGSNWKDQHPQSRLTPPRGQFSVYEHALRIQILWEFTSNARGLDFRRMCSGVRLQIADALMIMVFV